MKDNTEENSLLDGFTDPALAARYKDGVAQFVPGFADLHKMASILLAERMPADGTVLVHGAGGGLEMRAFADAHKGWSFVGVDPAEPMLEEAKLTMGRHAERAYFHHGYIDDAPEGPFDAASSLLTLHFLGRDDRIKVASDIRRRLVSGAPFVVVHTSFPQAPDERDIWLARYAQFAMASGVDAEQANHVRGVVGANLPIYEPEADADLLRQAGFQNVSSFYSGFTWHGWVAYAP